MCLKFLQKEEIKTIEKISKFIILINTVIISLIPYRTPYISKLENKKKRIVFHLDCKTEIEKLLMRVVLRREISAMPAPSSCLDKSRGKRKEGKIPNVSSNQRNDAKRYIPDTFNRAFLS